jgi:hypothetical protein
MKPSTNRVGKNGSKTVTLSQARKGRATSTVRAADEIPIGLFDLEISVQRVSALWDVAEQHYWEVVHAAGCPHAADVGCGLIDLDPTTALRAALNAAYKDVEAVRSGGVPAHGLLDMEAPVRKTAALLLMTADRLCELHESTFPKRGKTIGAGIYDLVCEEADYLIEEWEDALKRWRSYMDGRDPAEVAEERRAA